MNTITRLSRPNLDQEPIVRQGTMVKYCDAVYIVVISPAATYYLVDLSDGEMTHGPYEDLGEMVDYLLRTGFCRVTGPVLIEPDGEMGARCDVA